MTGYSNVFKSQKSVVSRREIDTAQQSYNSLGNLLLSPSSHTSISDQS